LSEEQRHVSTSPETTESIGERLAAELLPGDVLLLEGDLAAGKTTLVRGLMRGLGGDGDQISSPSFVLLRTHDCDHPDIDRLHHVDLYRLADSLPDLREIGIAEVMSDHRSVVAVEWPKELLAAWLPRDARLWRVRIDIGKGEDRELTIVPREGRRR
jgi:tRNA threonylcarbamoyl adenosine modification protein YjeE